MVKPNVHEPPTVKFIKGFMTPTINDVIVFNSEMSMDVRVKILFELETEIDKYKKEIGEEIFD
jgi:hypothetical protein